MVTILAGDNNGRLQSSAPMQGRPCSQSRPAYITAPQKASIAVLDTPASSLTASEPVGALLPDSGQSDRRCRILIDINRHFVEWRCRLGQIEQRVALYRAWDMLPEALQRSCAEPPRYLEALGRQPSDEEDLVLAEAWQGLENYINGSWRRLKQCIDATVEDIRRQELSAEIELRIIQVQCSPPIMWIAPSTHLTLPKGLLLDARKALATQNIASKLIVVPKDATMVYSLSLLVGRSCRPDANTDPCHKFIPLAHDRKEHLLPSLTLGREQKH